MNLFHKLILVTLLISASQAIALGHVYERKEVKQQIIHIITIDPKHYVAEIVKSNDGALGRETVASMAKRSNATIAINGGFFEIGGARDGKATGTLVIKGHKYKVKNQIQPLVVIKDGNISIEQSNPKKYLSDKVSILSAIPLLIKDGKLISTNKKTSKFYTTPHARTSIGIRADGTIVIVVAEHNYLRDLNSITTGEIQSLMQERGKALAKKYHHKSTGDITISELKSILKTKFSAQHGAIGLTIDELAILMQALGCKDALNLDGGGSSTLWVEGKIINQAIGDKEEDEGTKVTRPVSDAIIFKKL